MGDENARATYKRVYLPRWALVMLGVLLCLLFFLVGISVGRSGAVPHSIVDIFASPTQTPAPAPELSQEAILQVISHSVQSGQPLYLVGANLSGANLVSANLSGADLSTSDLSNADLYGANLSGTNLFGAYLFGADLRDADLRDADLRKTFLGKTRIHQKQ